MVGHSMFFGHPLYNRCNIGIVDTAYLREEVVFNLVIESTDVPAQQLVLMSKIGSGFHLMDHPGILNITFHIFSGMIGSFHNMGQLKDNSEYYTGCQVNRHEADQELPPGDRQHKHGYHQHVGVIYDLGDNKGDPLRNRMALIFIGPKVVLEEILIVLNENPKQCSKAVCHKSEIMLRLMDRLVVGMGREPDKLGYFKILIMLVDIGIGVMYYIMGYFPDVTVGTEQVK